MAPGGALPNLVIIGAQKCGTTALHSYLSRHPEISMSTPKELDFFIDGKNRERGLDWYRSHFDPAAKVRGESSPNYTADPVLAGVPERMAKLLPDARLIYMVRDPIERVRANWIHRFSNRAESRPFEQAVLESPEYVARSRYHHQLNRFLGHYPRERVLVIAQDDLLAHRRATLEQVWRFLGVREDVWKPAFEIKRLETSERRRKTVLGAAISKRVSIRVWRRLRDRAPFSRPFEHPELRPELRAVLAERLREDTARLRELTGREFPEWSI